MTDTETKTNTLAACPPLSGGLAADTEMTCGNCANRSGEECEAHCGREVYADADKPDWCNEWSER